MPPDMTDGELRAKMQNLRAVDAQEIGGRAGEVASLIEEILNLRRWKREQLTMESWWKEVDTAVRTHPEMVIGQTVAGAALALINERDQFKRLSEEAIAFAEKCEPPFQRPT